MGPYPFPEMVRDFQAVISKEIKEQLMEKEGRLPDAVLACVGGGSNAIGAFYNFIPDKSVRLIGCEAAGRGIDTFETVSADTMENLMGPMKVIVIAFEILGMIMGVFVLYLLINMIVSESSTNISVMKVLGFSRKEISNRVLNVNHVLICLGFILGFPIAYLFVKVGYADTIENYGML